MEKLEKLEEHNKRVYYLFVGLNCLAVAFYGVVLVMQQTQRQRARNNPGEPCTLSFSYDIAAKLIIGVLQCFSFVTIIYSTIKIFKQVKHASIHQHMNTRMLCITAISCALFIISGLAYCIAMFNYQKELNSASETQKQQRIALITACVVVFFEFAAQICYLLIFMNLSQIKVERSKTTVDFDMDQAEE